MKQFLLFVLLILVAVFGISQVVRHKIGTDLAQPVADTVLSPSPTLVIDKNQVSKSSLFVPYWTLADNEEIDKNYDQYIYFGVAPDMMFTVGLFSVLDALIGIPMDQVLENMPLARDIALAITQREGPCGRLLAGIEAHEKGDWDGVQRAGLDLSILSPAWVDALVWVRGVRSMMTSAVAGGQPLRKTSPAI